MTSAALRMAAWSVLARLPADAQRRLADVAIEETSGLPPLGDAGARDVRIKAMDAPIAVLVGVLVHELGHIAGDHVVRVMRGEISASDAEQEADHYARSWGFGKEIIAAQRWARAQRGHGQ